MPSAMCKLASNTMFRSVAECVARLAGSTQDGMIDHYPLNLNGVIVMDVKLISWPSFGAEALCGLAAAECYQGKNFERSLQIAMDGKHFSVAEHAAFTFHIKDVSRVLLAQLTRHRIASFSVQSQRYCGVKVEWVVPPSFKELGLEEDYIAECNRSYEAYCRYVERGVPKEDARFVIPQGVTCRLLMTMNVRELLHFLELRTCNRAQWEIRELADEVLKACKHLAPKLFANAGCGCVNGICPEGGKSCGHPRNKSEWD